MSDYANFDHLIERLEGMDGDADRWRFILENPDLFTVFLDNDDTYVQCIGDDRDEPKYVQLDYIGCSDGVFTLCEALGVNAEGV